VIKTNLKNSIKTDSIWSLVRKLLKTVIKGIVSFWGMICVVSLLISGFIYTMFGLDPSEIIYMPDIPPLFAGIILLSAAIFIIKLEEGLRKEKQKLEVIERIKDRLVKEQEDLLGQIGDLCAERDHPR